VNAPDSAPLLGDALVALRQRLKHSRLALEVGGVDEARAIRDELAGQIDDYFVPRLRALHAPLLAVVGGSTGAGKSTLVNSLVGTEVSPAGVLRPTTLAPVLVSHPDDARWFSDDRVLPGFARTTGRVMADASGLNLVTDDDAPCGLALLDAPDIDSVVHTNRELASQLLAAADLWVFVTTAARYADAVPWGWLRKARARSTALALVLNRVPPGALGEVPEHFLAMLADEGLEEAPVFTIAEVTLERGMIPERSLHPLREWLRGLASDAAARAEIVRRTLEGALDSLDERVSGLAAHVDAQAAAAASLRAEAARAYAAARSEIDDVLSAGSLLRGEVLQRWQEVIGTGDLMRSLETRIGRLRDRLRGALLGEPAPFAEVRATLESNLEDVVLAAADRAAEQTTIAWRASAAGSALLDASDGSLERSSPELRNMVRDAIRAWQRHVLELVREEGASKRATGRALSLGVNAVGAALMVSVFAHTGGLTGAELAVAGGTATVSQKLLEALFGDQAVRSLTATARGDLVHRIATLFGHQAARFGALLVDVAPDPADGIALRRTAERVQVARS
jgi:hypothetical protein